MRKYIITVTDRYEVEAESAELALKSYRIHFDDIEGEIFGLDEIEAISQDDFEYLDGSVSVEESSDE
jgi:hypothetical protein